MMGSGSGGGFDGEVKMTAENIKAPTIPTIWNFLSMLKNQLESFYSFPNLKRVYTSEGNFVQRGGEVRSSRRAHNPKTSSSNLLPAIMILKISDP